MLFVRAYPRETPGDGVRRPRPGLRLLQGHLHARHLRQHEDGGGDDLRRQGAAYNRRFLQMCGHYLVEPVACTPASGWEKGQVENQVGLVRERFFTPRLRVKSYEELNAWLLDKCVAYAKAHRIPSCATGRSGRCSRPSGRAWCPMPAASTASMRAASVSKTCLVRFDNNKYSVLASAVGRPVEIRAYADRIEHAPGRRMVVGEHPAASAATRRLRSLALCAGAGPQARRAAQRRAVQGLGAAAGMERSRKLKAGAMTATGRW
jgi:hypothetical protein